MCGDASFKDQWCACHLLQLQSICLCARPLLCSSRGSPPKKTTLMLRCIPPPPFSEPLTSALMKKMRDKKNEKRTNAKQTMSFFKKEKKIQTWLVQAIPSNAPEDAQRKASVCSLQRSPSITIPTPSAAQPQQRQPWQLWRRA